MAKESNLMEIEAWASSDGTVDSDVDNECNDEEELNYASGSMGKLQFRKDVSKAQWDAVVGMAKIIEKKGGMWTTTGIIRRSELYCSIEETLYLVERGALVLLDVNFMVLPLENMYGMISDGKSECSWESFQAYKHLKSLGYIVRRHGVPWTLKIDKSSADLTSLDASSENSDKLEPEISVTKLLLNMQINDMKPAFDVYLPNSKFKKSSPGDPSFLLFLSRGYPPSNLEIEDLEVCCNGIPIKFCHIESGRVSFFSFDKVELPQLP
ncbi:hypothetical protein Syun_014642 [Stephania yunnanensis]|uniref:tRNA-splicing endonuclease subunit Sen54 N-terminal domain-containing protein n=1 Tax=Stephania yunnanensis TaxID=152371 RepID=A0AAP0JJX9_9MAGN